MGDEEFGKTAVERSDKIRHWLTTSFISLQQSIFSWDIKNMQANPATTKLTGRVKKFVVEFRCSKFHL